MMNEFHRRWSARVVCLLLGTSLVSVTFAAPPASTRAANRQLAQPAAAGGLAVGKLVDQRDEWFKSPENLKLVDNICSWQNANGGWWKAYDVSSPRPKELPEAKGGGPPGRCRPTPGTAPARSTTVRRTARCASSPAHRVTGERKYADAFNRGLKFLFDAQYPNGGWPQRFPLEQNYGRHITYNDDAMVGVMRLLKDIADRKPDFAFVSDPDRQHAGQSFAKGVECILDTQVKVNGKPTVWCQQHDAQTLAPAKARRLRTAVALQRGKRRRRQTADEHRQAGRPRAAVDRVGGRVVRGVEDHGQTSRAAEAARDTRAAGR